MIEVKGPSTDDGTRSVTGGWFEAGGRWASLTPLTGAERVAAAENAAVETLKFRVRRDSLTTGIGPGTHRLQYNDRAYDIQAKQEVEKHAFDLLVTGRADQPATAQVQAQD